MKVVFRYFINNELKKYNIKFYVHVENRYKDLLDPLDNLQSGLMAEFNQYFVELTKQKVTSVLKRRAKSGKGWGIPPYGFMYDKDGYYIHNTEECITVKMIYDMSLKGIGIETIARHLNDLNIPTRYNNYSGVIRIKKGKNDSLGKIIIKKDIKWSGNSIRGIIKNKMFHGEKTIKDIKFNIEPLFSFTYWFDVNTNLSNNNKNTKGEPGGKVKYDYLLNGLIRCGKCGRNYNGKRRLDKSDNFYYCMSKRERGKNCANRSINIDIIESFICKLLFEDWRLYDRIKKEFNAFDITEIQAEIKEINVNLSELQRKKDNIISVVESGIFSITEIADRVNEIRNQIEEQNDKKIKLETKSYQVKSNEIDNLKIDLNYFKNLDFISKRNLITKYIKSIDVLWIDDKFNDIKVSYYIIRIKLKIYGIVDYFTNGYNMDLNTWFNLLYDSETDENYYDEVYQNEKSRERWGDAESLNSDFDIFKEMTTLVPCNLIQTWSEEDVIDYYGKRKYDIYKTELEHKKQLKFKELFIK